MEMSKKTCVLRVLRAVDGGATRSRRRVSQLQFCLSRSDGGRDSWKVVAGSTPDHALLVTLGSAAATAASAAERNAARTMVACAREFAAESVPQKL